MRIELSNVGFCVDNQTILQHINLHIPSGSFSILCGQTGSGKSTLLQILAGLEAPSTGSVEYLAGGERVQYPRKRIGTVFQLPEMQLFAGTVLEDIEYGLELRRMPKADRLQKVQHVLEIVGLEPATFLDRSPFLVSGGEKRRVAIAAALVLEPEVLILDEPTAGLDPAAARELTQVLQELHAKGITIVVATHDLDTFIPVAEQMVLLQDGTLNYVGSPQQVVADPLILQEAGLELPEAARIAQLLRKRGFQLDIPLRVEELLPFFADIPLQTDSRWERQAAETTREAVGEAEPATRATAAATAFEIEETAKGSLSVLEKLDPRCKWFTMVGLSILFLRINSGWGFLLSFAAIFLLIWLANLPWRKAWRWIRSYLPMFLFFLLVSAISFQTADYWVGPIGISWQGAIRGGVGLARFALLIYMGILYTETTTGAPLREGFEWLIRPLRKAGVPVHDLSLAVTIALQFVPWIVARVAELRKAFAARGQDTIGIRKWTPRQMSLLFVPMLLAVLTMGDELATAIESRGYNGKGERTSFYKLKWTPRDSAASMLALFFMAALWWIG